MIAFLPVTGPGSRLESVSVSVSASASEGATDSPLVVRPKTTAVPTVPITDCFWTVRRTSSGTGGYHAQLASPRVHPSQYHRHSWHLPTAAGARAEPERPDWSWSWSRG